MDLINKDLILKEVPLFADLSGAELDIIKERSSITEYKKGQVVYTEGSPPSAFYCLVLGRVLIYTQDQSGNKKILEYLHRGKYFGIISLLTDEPHSVSASCLNNSVMLSIEKKDFDFVLEKIPRLAIDLSRTLSRRLKRKELHQKTIFESTIISVFSSYSQAGKTLYALNLALCLAKETRKSVIVLDIAPNASIHSLPEKLGIKSLNVLDLCTYSADTRSLLKSSIIKTAFNIDLICFYYSPEDETCVKSLVDILSLLVNDYHYLILDLPASMDRQILGLLNQSDLIQVLTSPAQVDLERTRHLVQRLKDEFNFQADKIKIIINEYKLSKLSHSEQIEFLNNDIFATLPKIDFESIDRLVLDEPESEYAKAVRRISRNIGDCSVGLVLGVGVGYGFCHIGVLRVIEQERIPIDIIIGSSVGAVIATLWAVGKTSDEILEITREFKEPKSIWGLVDLTIPLLGFIKGNKLRRFLKRHLGNKTFHDTRLPLKIIASDVKRKEPRVIDEGSLVEALMASCSMPGVFAPFKFKEEVLFDGGVTYPLPTEPLIKMGIKKIIAINVTPSREDVSRQYEKIKQEVTASHFKTNILDIIFSSVEILQSEVAQKEAQLADVVLHPDTSGLYWLELNRAPEFAKRGEEEARRNLEKIWQVINE